jgi:hypothetical protein
MRVWTPVVELSNRLPRQSRFEERFGGRPWGLPVTRWPFCASCKGGMSLIAQLRHAEDRLDLGARQCG